MWSDISKLAEDWKNEDIMDGKPSAQTRTISQRNPGGSFRWFALPLFFCSVGSSAETLTGRVVDISDGDTITVLDAERTEPRIRLAGSNAAREAAALRRAIQAAFRLLGLQEGRRDRIAHER